MHAAIDTDYRTRGCTYKLVNMYIHMKSERWEHVKSQEITTKLSTCDMDGTCVTKVNCCHMACEERSKREIVCCSAILHLPATSGKVQYRRPVCKFSEPFGCPQPLSATATLAGIMATNRAIDSQRVKPTDDETPLTNVQYKIWRRNDYRKSLMEPDLQICTLLHFLLLKWPWACWSQTHSTKLTVAYWLQVIKMVKIFLDSGVQSLTHSALGSCRRWNIRDGNWPW